MNKNLFKSGSVMNVPKANAVNEAGGLAYSVSDKHALAQYVVTGCLNGTYYAGGSEQLDEILRLANKCDSQFVAKAAVYARKNAKMKDTPALLLAVLSTRKDGNELFPKAFKGVVNDTKTLRNFAQIVRSGKVGRRSFGTRVKNVMQNWLTEKPADFLFTGSIGESPSLADVIKMVHVKPENEQKNQLYRWLIGREYNVEEMSPKLKAYEAFKKNPTGEIPDVPFQMLTNFPLTDAQWVQLARNVSWNTLRMNLNTFGRHGVYKKQAVVDELAARLSDAEAVRKFNVFPYQLMTAFQNTEDIPVELKLALQQAMEIATENVPVINGKVAVAVDTSGSMSSPVTGNRGSVTTKTRCIDVAALIGSCVLRKNPKSIILPFDTSVHSHNLNPMDSVMTNAQKLSRYGGGGTDCGSAIAHLNANDIKADLIWFVSDNESWYGQSRWGGTSVVEQWKKFKGRNPQAKMACLNIQPYGTVQAPDDKNVMNLGGWSDSVFDIVANFANGSADKFVDVVESVEL